MMRFLSAGSNGGTGIVPGNWYRQPSRNDLSYKIAFSLTPLNEAPYQTIAARLVVVAVYMCCALLL
jgi:hypothetical protein